MDDTISINDIDRLELSATPKNLCKFCQKEFLFNRSAPNKVFCSSTCLKAFYRDKYSKDSRPTWSEKRKCAFCGNEFEWVSTQANKKYCSKECLMTATNEKAKRKVWTELRACAFCGNDFEWYSNKSNQKYCSAECAINANNKKLKQEVRSEKRKCALCNNEFEWFSSKPNQRYCSLECQQAATKINAKNNRKNAKSTDEQLKNAVYLKVLDIISKMDQAKGSSFNGVFIDYSAVGDISEKTREIVLSRDKYECQICKRKDSLQLHHLIKRRYGGNHKAENLITLCAPCHRHIETGDIEHAANKCYKNAKRYYDQTVSDENLDINDLDVTDLREKLILLFDKLKESSVSTDADIMICIDEALGLLDTQ